MLDKDRPLHARQAVLLAIARSEEADEVTVLADATLTMRTALPAEMEEVWARTLGKLEFEHIAKDLADIASDEQADMEQRRLAIRLNFSDAIFLAFTLFFERRDARALRFLGRFTLALFLG